MHDTAVAAGTAFFSAYFGSPAPEGRAPRVLDLGAMNVNGSLRDLAPPGTDYVGADLAPGPGVDVVLQPGADLPFPPGSFDASVSTSCFEHDGAFWETALRVSRLLRPGGLLYVNAPSNGPYHAFPRDNWRFYPDAGLALAEWVRAQDEPLHLLESAVLRRRTDWWNDFVAVFVKHPAPAAPARFMLDDFPDAMNMRRIGQDGLLNPEPTPEDVQLSATRQRDLEHWVAEARRHEAEAAALRTELEAMRGSASWRLTRPVRAAAQLLRG